MKRFAISMVGLALVVALLAPGGLPAEAQPVAQIALPAPGTSKALYPGCNAIALTFPDGTPSMTVIQAVTPSEAVQAMWRHDAAQNRYEGFSPAAPQASDLLTVNFLDPVWLCIPGAAAAAPTASPPTPPPPSPPPVHSSGALIDGIWTVTATVTHSSGPGMRPVGTVFGSIWTISTENCQPHEGCDATVVSSAGAVLNGPYSATSDLGKLLVSWSEDKPQAPCFRLVGVEVRLTKATQEGTLRIATEFAGHGIRQVNYLTATNPPPGCAFAVEATEIVGVRSAR